MFSKVYLLGFPCLFNSLARLGIGFVENLKVWQVYSRSKIGLWAPHVSSEIGVQREHIPILAELSAFHHKIQVQIHSPYIKCLLVQLVKYGLVAGVSLA